MSKQQSSPTSFDGPYVDYGSIVTQLLNALRIRRSQEEAMNGPCTTAGRIHDFYAVGVKGAPASGKTRFCMERYLEDEEGTILIVKHISTAVDIRKTLVDNHGCDQAIVDERIISAAGALREMNLYAPTSIDIQERRSFTIEIDPNDKDPAKTLASFADEYKERQAQIRDRILPHAHPVNTVRTIIVDGAFLAEQKSGLNFPRMMRYSQMGGQRPEFILID